MPGATPNFNHYDILHCLILIKQGISSRHHLTKALCLGEGSIRTVLEILKSKKLIRSSRRGHSLTSTGIKLLNKLNYQLVQPKFIKTDLIPDYRDHFQMALLLKKNILSLGLRHRDIAIKKGADAALLLTYRDSLSGWGIEDQDLSELNNLYNYTDENVLILTFADTKRVAFNSAFAVAENINKNVKELICF